MKQINTTQETAKLLNLPQKKKKHAGGRPQKTPKSMGLPDNWKDIILEWSAKGCSDVEIRAKLCLHSGTFDHSTWEALEIRNEEFSTTIKKAKILCQAWWEEQGRENLEHTKNRVFETALWFINMKNRFGWQDKTEVNHGMTDDTFEKYKSLSVTDLKQKLDTLLGS